MDTKELIKAISADTANSSRSMRSTWALASGLSIAAAAIAFMAMLGPRLDFAQSLSNARFIMKFVVSISVALTAYAILNNLSRPAAKPQMYWLFLGPALVIISVVLELLSVPPDQWEMRLIGTNSIKCLTFIPLIGLGPLVALLAALRYGAPTRPTLSGTMAGILAGGLAAAFYAAHCPDDSPLFVATWYTIAIIMLGAAGAFLGPRIARW